MAKPTSIFLIFNKFCCARTLLVRTNHQIKYVRRCITTAGLPKLDPQNYYIEQQTRTRGLSNVAGDSDDNPVVYKGLLKTRILRVKAISVAGSFLGMCFLPKILPPALETGLASALAVGTFSSFFIVVTPILLHWICKRYVTELEFDRNSKLFKATVISLFFRSKTIEFTAQEVVVPGTPLLLTSFVVRGFPLLVDAEEFTDINVYKHLLGYDKPFIVNKTKEET